MENEIPKNSEKSKNTDGFLEGLPEEKKQKYLRELDGFCLLDDTYAREFFRQHPELAERVLRIITGFDDLVIDREHFETQYDAWRMTGTRSMVMDVVAGDTQGRRYDLEVENWDASPERAETQVAAMIAECLLKGSKFKELPEMYVIFMCSSDSVGNGRALNRFSYRNDDVLSEVKPEVGTKPENRVSDSMKGKTHIIFVNGKYKDEETEIGKLIHDFNCRNADEMYFKDLANRAHFLKQEPEGKEQMCRAMDEIINEEMIEVAKKMLAGGKISHEDIANYTGLTLEKVKKLAGQMAS